MSDTSRMTTISVPDVCCAAEETSVRKAFRNLDAVEEIQFDLTNRTLRVRHSGDTAVVLQTLAHAGFPGRVTSQRGETTTQVSIGRRASILLSLLLLVAGLAASFLSEESLVPTVLFLASMVSGGWEIAIRCIRALRALRLDVNVLMTVAAAGAVVLGEYAEGAAVLSLYALSLLLEALSIDRTWRAIGNLVALAPETACLRTPAGEQSVRIEVIRPGDTILVRPGERIPLDGRVILGETSVDESQLTGESMPVFKGGGSDVFAGSLNGQGALDIQVTKPADGTLLHAIGEMVDAARRQKSNVQTFLERFAARYVPGIFVASVVVATLPPFLLGEPYGEWFYRALTLLVISCPCALLLSTPMAVVSAITGAAKFGALIRNGEVLERLSEVRAVAIDKTGTITHGFHEVTTVRPLDHVHEETIIRVSAVLESRSEHPLASAILRFARSRQIDVAGQVSRFEILPGRGVRGTIDGTTYVIGNHSLMEENGVCSPGLEKEIEALERRGETVLILSDEKRPLGLIATKDTTRSEAGTAIRELHDLTGSPVTLLTGDNKTVADSLAKDLGIQSVRPGLLPAEKAGEVDRLTALHGPVAMVGDGINDAPALARAHVGIAMGAAGSDTAIQAADVVLLASSISAIPALLRLGRSAHGIIQFNISVALLTKALFLILGVAGFSSLWFAVLADDGVTLLVILNSLRLLSPRSFAHR